MTFDEWCKYQWQEDYVNGLRVGQSYLNRVEPSLSWPELFYERDTNRTKKGRV